MRDKKRSHIRIKKQKPIQVGRSRPKHKVSTLLNPPQQANSPILDPVTNDIRYSHPRQISSAWLIDNIPQSVQDLIQGNSLTVNPDRMRREHSDEYYRYLIQPYLDRYRGNGNDDWLYIKELNDKKIINFQPNNINDHSTHTLSHIEMKKIAHKQMEFLVLDLSEQFNSLNRQERILFGDKLPNSMKPALSNDGNGPHLEIDKVAQLNLGRVNLQSLTQVIVKTNPKVGSNLSLKALDIEKVKEISKTNTLYDRIVSSSAVHLAMGSSIENDGTNIKRSLISDILETTTQIEDLKNSIDKYNIVGSVLTRKESKTLNKLISSYLKKVDEFQKDMDGILETNTFINGNVIVKKNDDVTETLEKIDEMLKDLISDDHASDFNSIGTIRNPFTGIGGGPLSELLASYDETIQDISQITKSRKYNGADTNDLTSHKGFQDLDPQIDALGNSYAKLISAFIQNDDFNNKLVDYTSYATNRNNRSNLGGKSVSDIHANRAIVAGAITPLINKNIIDYVNRANKWVDKSNTKGKRRTFRRVIYDAKENKYKAVLVVSGTKDHKIGYNAKMDVASDPSLSPFIKIRVMSDPRLTQFDLESIIYGTSDFKDQMFEFSITNKERESLEGMLYQLYYMGLDGSEVINDFIRGIADIEIDMVGSNNYRLLSQLRNMYSSTQDEIIEDSIQSARGKYSVAKKIQDYPWDIISGNVPEDVFLIENFDFRNQIKVDDSIQDLISFGREIGLISVLKTDKDGFPSEVIFSHESNVISEIRANTKEERLKIYNKIQSVLSSADNGINNEIKDQVQRAAISHITENWSVKDVIIFSNMFGMPMGTSTTDKMKRKDFLAQIDDKLLDEVFLDNPELLMTYRELMGEPVIDRTSGDVILEVPKMKLKSFLTNMAFDTQLSNAIENTENAINSRKTNEISSQIENLDQIITSGEYEEVISDLDLKKEQEMARAYFMAILTDVRKNHDTLNQTSNTKILNKWDELIATLSVSEEKDYAKAINDLVSSEGKTRDGQTVDLFESSEWNKMDSENRNAIVDFLKEHNQSDEYYHNQMQPEELLPGLLEIGVTKGESVAHFNSLNRKSSSALQIAIVKELFGKLLARSKTEKEFGLDLKNIINNSDKLETALKDVQFPVASSGPIISASMVNIAKMPVRSGDDGKNTSIQGKLSDDKTAKKVFDRLGVDAKTFKEKADKESGKKPKSDDGRTTIGKINQMIKEEKSIERSQPNERSFTPMNQVRDNIEDVTEEVDNFFTGDDLTPQEEIFLTDLSTKNEEIKQAARKIEKLQKSNDPNAAKKIQKEEGRVRQIIKTKIRNIDQIVPQTIMDIDQLTIEEINSDSEVNEIIKRSSNDGEISRFREDYPSINEKNLFFVRGKLVEELERIDTSDVKKDNINIGNKAPIPIKFEETPFKNKDLKNTNLSSLKRLSNKGKNR